LSNISRALGSNGYILGILHARFRLHSSGSPKCLSISVINVINQFYFILQSSKFERVKNSKLNLTMSEFTYAILASVHIRHVRSIDHELLRYHRHWPWWHYWGISINTNTQPHWHRRSERSIEKYNTSVLNTKFVPFQLGFDVRTTGHARRSSDMESLLYLVKVSKLTSLFHKSDEWQVTNMYRRTCEAYYNIAESTWL